VNELLHSFPERINVQPPSNSVGIVGMPKQNNQAELALLTAVDDETIISQAALSERLGVATGLINFMMKRAIGKGLVTVKKVPARRYAYLLTPKGFIEKARLVAD
jgi:DNA-binding MarR family transcriptional regulator